VASFSHGLVEVPARRRFALRDAVAASQSHNGTYLGKAVGEIGETHNRISVIIDRQARGRRQTKTNKGRRFLIRIRAPQFFPQETRSPAPSVTRGRPCLTLPGLRWRLLDKGGPYR
jgi:hypothetical protein